MKIKKNNQIKFTCPFCKNIINASSKTEIMYRSTWIDGCNNCFTLSIDQNTNTLIQAKILEA